MTAPAQTKHEDQTTGALFAIAGTRGRLGRIGVGLGRLALAPRVVIPPAGLPPVVLGICLAAAAGAAAALVIGLLLVGAASANVMVAAMNDLADEDVDWASDSHVAQIAGGSRILQDGVATRTELWAFVVVSGGVVAVCLLVGALTVTWLMVPVLVVGFALVVGYSVGPRLVGRGVGEAGLAFTCGVIPVAGAYLAVTSTLSWQIVVVGVAPSALAMVSLLSAHVLDREADAAVGKRTLAVRLAPTAIRALEGSLVGVAVLCVTFGAAVGLLPVSALFVAVPACLSCLGPLRRGDHADAVRASTTANLVVCGALAASVAVDATGVVGLTAVAVAGAVAVCLWWAWTRLQARLFGPPRRDYRMAAASHARPTTAALRRPSAG